ncbi:3'-5' exonuclease [Parabacteroides sp. Marseille-P3160]|uniref:3'-5' exonuclease n=1 Tax=Parabacteroides sp. Marseille-P3160 TaxID=1917887 RepID=UPI0009BA473E|nr:3'-5' exonuclease [Parabacteroides sp. Marseille-P3160]
MHYINTIKKEEIASLPIEEFPGQIIVVERENQVPDAIKVLTDSKEVGFDTETRPTFAKGKTHQVALIQLSTEEICYLFRLNLLGMPKELEFFLKDMSVKKIGLSLRDDFNALRKRTNIEPVNFLDLQNYVSQYGIDDASLQKIYAILFKKKISKRARLSNWESGFLTEAQQKYAALDAWACLRIYKFLNLPQ